MSSQTISCPSCHQPNRSAARFCAHCGGPLLLQNKYRIVRLLGRGGFGSVYLGEHLTLQGVFYAIKELTADPLATPEQRQQAESQFLLEASLLAKLNHPVLPKVWDSFSENGRQFLVMEYVEGETLEERLKAASGPLPEAQVLRWADDLLDALAYLHGQQPPVVHRDIKSTNIKLTPDGKIKLLDFGIAKKLFAGTQTGSAARAVSAPFSPMEQYGAGTDARSDIYALGVTLYHLLTNYLPPEAPDRASLPVTPPHALNAWLSPATEAAVLKAMAERPIDRFQSAAEFRAALHTPAPVPARTVAAQVPNLAGAATIVAQVPAAAPAKKQGLSLFLLGAAAVLALSIVCVFLFIVSQISQQSASVAAAHATATRLALDSASTSVAADSATQEAIFVQGTRTAEAAATRAAAAEATRTAAAEATSAAAEQATVVRATAQAAATIDAAQADMSALTKKATKAFGPVSQKLDHRDDNVIPGWTATGKYTNFIAEITFDNPFAASVNPWDYGIGFRSTGYDEQYRLVVDSDAAWNLTLDTAPGGKHNSEIVASGTVTNLDVSEGRSNTFQLFVNGRIGYFYFNEDYIATLDLSGKTDQGEVWAGTGFYTGNQIKGHSTAFRDFTIWSLP